MYSIYDSLHPVLIFVGLHLQAAAAMSTKPAWVPASAKNQAPVNNTVSVSLPSSFTHFELPQNLPTSSANRIKQTNEGPTQNGDRRQADSGQNSIAADSATNGNEEELPDPPDGGYGWVIVAASFCANMIADGCCFSFGVFFAELIDVFGESRSKTAWVGSVFVSMPSICGPIASALTDRFGCRRTMIAGGLIASAGCAASAFVNSIDLLCLTFGIVTGFGLSLVFLPATLMVAFYFKRRRAFATGLC
jgi:hypothetical protein